MRVCLRCRHAPAPTRSAWNRGREFPSHSDFSWLAIVCEGVFVGQIRPRPNRWRIRALHQSPCFVLTSYGAWHAHKIIFEGLPSNLLIVQTLWRPIASRYAFQVNLKFFNMTMRCNKIETKGFAHEYVCINFRFGLLNITFCLYLYNKNKIKVLPPVPTSSITQLALNLFTPNNGVCISFGGG